MKTIFRMAVMLLSLLSVTNLAAQSIKGKIIDAHSKEPLSGVSIHCTEEGCQCGCTTNQAGEFSLNCKNCKSHIATYIGYNSFELQGGNFQLISLFPSSSIMNEVVISSTKGQLVKRAEAPVAITGISTRVIQDAKPTSLDQLLNKVSGVYMANLGNEQHTMSIRQPMTTKSLFLYLEDGIPVRTTGLFNHNALLEMNMAAVRKVEVIKGPSSSLYGSEAIGGVVNFITMAPTAVPVLKMSLQGNDIGYRRGDFQSGYKKDRIGFTLNGYYANRKNSFIEYSDFNKLAITGRIDYDFSNKTSWINSISYIRYESDMSGNIDSTRFANRSFTSMQTFTYRNVNSLRYRSSLDHAWNESAKTSLSLVYRDNSIEQNPAYSIKNDRRRLSNGNWVGKKDLAHGEINNSSFSTYMATIQHRQQLGWKNASVMGGFSLDYSPTTYVAEYIRIKLDTLTGKYASYQQMDSLLTRYDNRITNQAAFLNYEMNLTEKMKFVGSVRYDRFTYNFMNHLQPSSFSGSPDTINRFSAFSPKLGITYSLNKSAGLYANYSQGFVPPQVTEMYRGVKVPDLRPSSFYNYEIGGWAELVSKKLSVDFSIYQLDGTNEIVSVRLDDGSTENRNTGKTSHSGIELGLNGNPIKEISLRFSGAYSKHHFRDFVEKGTSFNGNEMSGAPRWMHNAEAWYRPSFLKGLRVGLEWQQLGSYYMDPANTTKYNGFNVFHLRAGYQVKGMEIWMNIMNAANSYYAYTSSRSAFGYNYTPAEPRNFNVGISYNFANLLKK